jgi:vitamin B12 transporter
MSRTSRNLRILFVSTLLAAACVASELTIKVLDPNGAAVAGANVNLYRAQSPEVLATGKTNATGTTKFDGLKDAVRVEVLAPGFATSARELVADGGVAEFKLQVVAQPVEVTVSATRTPIEAQQSGSVVESLDRLELENLQPVSAGEALRFVPGAVLADSGQHGGITSLFVRGGESRYNKVIVDGVPVNESGGTFNFGVVPLVQIDRLELARGPQSTLYGSDAVTSVVQLWSRTGHTRIPELTFGADGGNFGTAHGYGALAGARDRFDYDFFADYFDTQGQDVNDTYFNTLEGGNVGVVLSRNAGLRVRARHFNSRTGTPGAWNYNGQALLPQDIDAHARQNDFLGSVELNLNAPSRWQHRFRVYDYSTVRVNQDDLADRGCDPVSFIFTDCFFKDAGDQVRAGFEYQADYQPRSWAHSTFGYEYENENGFFHTQFPTLDPTFSFVIAGGDNTHGLRRNHAIFGQQIIVWKGLTAIGGLRYVHNTNFGDRVVPRVALSYLLWNGNYFFSGTRLRGTYAEGIKEPRFEESFGISGTFPANPNPDLKPERSRSFEAGFIQNFVGGKYSLQGTYYNNLFRQQIAFESIFIGDPSLFIIGGQYFNVSRAIAHGAEVEFHGRLRRSLSLDGSYTYTSTQITASIPACGAGFTNCVDPLFAAGRPLLRRPKQAGSLALNYYGARWGGNIGGTFIGRRPDSDFLSLSLLGLSADHAAGYARFDLGAWYAVTRRVTAYANLENAFDKHYQDVVGYPGLQANVRAGVRFRIGGE